MSHYITRWCPIHGEWDDDVDNSAEACPTCITEGQIKSRADLERENAALRQKLTDWASDAFDDVSGWGGYASEYMQGKWHLEADLAKWQARAEETK